MSLITWNKTLEVGVERIDAEHKQLVRMLNELHDAMGAGRGSAVLGKLLGELVAYTVSHFGTEDRLMSQSSYPDIAKHRGEHDELKTTVAKLQQELASGRKMLTLDALHFLKSWLSNHILRSDKALGAYLTKAKTAAA